MKKLLLLCSIFMMLFLVGCAKVVSEESFEISAKVVETDFRSSYTTTTIVSAGKTMVPMTQYHSARYDVTLEYEGENYYLDNETYYNIAKEKEGQYVQCIMVTKKYDNGKERSGIEQILE